MRLEVIEYVELKDGGAVVTFEMDEDTRAGLISEALERRITEGLKNEIITSHMETGEGVDSVRSAPEPSGVQGMDENEGEIQE
jgi:hypothetical protein